MKQIELSAVGQVLTCTNLDTLNIVGDTIGQYEAAVTFDSSWDGYVPIVRFTKYGIRHDRPVIDGICSDFDAVLSGSGKFTIAIAGLTSDGEQITSTEVELEVVSSGFTKPGTILADAKFEALVTEALANDAAYERVSCRAYDISTSSTDFTYPTSKAVYSGIVKGLADFTSATPLVASAAANMTETGRMYLNSTDGYLYAYNGTEWVSTGVSYMASVLTNGSVSPEKTSFIDTTVVSEDVSPNIFDQSKATQGLLRTTDGTVNANYNTQFITTDYLPCVNGDKYYSGYVNKTSGTYGASSARVVAFYNSSKTFLSASENVNPAEVSNASAAYVKLSYDKQAAGTNTDGTYKIIVSKTAPTSYTAYYDTIYTYKKTVDSEIKIANGSLDPESVTHEKIKNGEVFYNKLSERTRIIINQPRPDIVPLYTENDISFVLTENMIGGLSAAEQEMYWVVSADDDSDTLTLGTGSTAPAISAITNNHWFGILVYDDETARPVIVLSQNSTAGTFTVFPKTIKAVTTGKLVSARHDVLHMSWAGYKAWAQHNYNQNPKYCEKNKYIDRYLPRNTPNTNNPEDNPFVGYGSYWKFITSCTNSTLRWRSARTKYDLCQRAPLVATAADSGCYWKKDLSNAGYDGFFETYIGTSINRIDNDPSDKPYKDTGYEMYIEWYLDDVLISQTIKTTNNCDRYCFDFYKNTNSAEIRIYYKARRAGGNADVISISDSTWWINEKSYTENDKIVPDFSTVVQNFDSHGEYPYVNQLPQYGFETEMKRLILNGSGIYVPYTNHSKGSQSTVWAKGWWYEYVLQNHPAVYLFDFGVNDSHSRLASIAQMTPTITGSDGTVYSALVTWTAYKQNIKDLQNMAMLHGIQPIHLGMSMGLPATELDVDGHDTTQEQYDYYWWKIKFFDDAQDVTT